MDNQLLTKFKTKVFNNPKVLTEEQTEKYIKELSFIAWKATGGANWEDYMPSKEGWAKFFSTKGGRPQDYDRIILLFDEDDKIVHFTGLTIFEVEGKKVVWVHVTLTDPKYQGQGVLNQSISNLINHEWIAELGSEALFIFRTPNPIVYHAMRKLTEYYEMDKRFKLDFYPKINEEGDIDPVPENIQLLGQKISKVISPDREFVSSKFVIKGYYKSLGAIFTDHKFSTKDSPIQRCFDKNVDASNEDGMFILVQIKIDRS